MALLGLLMITLTTTMVNPYPVEVAMRADANATQSTTLATNVVAEAVTVVANAAVDTKNAIQNTVVEAKDALKENISVGKENSSGCLGRFMVWLMLVAIGTGIIYLLETSDLCFPVLTNYHDKGDKAPTAATGADKSSQATGDLAKSSNGGEKSSSQGADSLKSSNSTGSQADAASTTPSKV